MTLTTKNIHVILYLVELSIFMLIVNSMITLAIGFCYWEVGLAIMGVSILALVVLKDERWDKLIISCFEWGLSFFLSDLNSFVLVLFGGGLV